MFLIIGHTGFLGSHLLDRYPDSYCQNSSGIFHYGEKINISITDLLSNHLVKAVIYCAVAYRSGIRDDINHVNVQYPTYLLEQCIPNDIYFIYFGSFFEKNLGSYMSEYVNSKLAFLAYMNKLGYAKAYYLRLEHIYGPNDRQSKFIPSVIQKIKKNDNIILNNPYHIRDFTPVQYVCDVVSYILDNNIKLNFFEIGTRIPQTTLSFVQLLLEHNISEFKTYSTRSRIIIDPKPSSSIPSSYADESILFQNFSRSYFHELERLTIQRLFSYD